MPPALSIPALEVRGLSRKIDKQRAADCLSANPPYVLLISPSLLNDGLDRAPTIGKALAVVIFTAIGVLGGIAGASVAQAVFFLISVFSSVHAEKVAVIGGTLTGLLFKLGALLLIASAHFAHGSTQSRALPT